MNDDGREAISDLIANWTAWRDRPDWERLRNCWHDFDRLDPVNPGGVVSLDTERRESFPEGYRHLVYLQTDLGYQVRRDLPGISGPATTLLYQAGERWLDGQPVRPDAI